MEREGFEPSKAEPTDLQSAPFGHSGTSPIIRTSVNLAVFTFYVNPLGKKGLVQNNRGFDVLR